MPRSAESSLWRSLAVALGEGVAFSVGMKLTNRVARQLEPASSGAGAAEHAGDAAFDRALAEVIVAAVDSRVQESEAAVERRIREGAARTAVELEALGQRHDALRAAMVRLNQDFAQAVAGIVREEVTRQVEARARDLERTLQEQILLLMEAARARTPGAAQPFGEGLAEWPDAAPLAPPLPIDTPRAKSSNGARNSGPRRGPGSRRKRTRAANGGGYPA